MRIRVFFHNRCFDGAASAAVFTRFYETRMHPGSEFSYTGMAHKASQLFDESQFDGDENAIVDFKYSNSPKLNWWFDHHQSAFLKPEDGDHFRQDKSGKKFFDPSYKSCTKLIATITKEKFGFEAPDLADLIHWADIVDGALFPNAETAVIMQPPALRIALVMEAGPDEGLSQWLIPKMSTMHLSEIVKEDRISRAFQPLFEQHMRSLEHIRQVGKCDRGVVFFDLTSPGIEVYNKFVPYYLFPECVYSVSVSPSSFRTKISVGSNPWNQEKAVHNLATICERYGGGGHPRVGAISLAPDSKEQALAISREIVTELQNPAKNL